MTLADIVIRSNSGLLAPCSTNTGEIKAYRNLPRLSEVHWFVLCTVEEIGLFPHSALSLKHTIFFFSIPNSRKVDPHQIGANSQFKSTEDKLLKKLHNTCLFFFFLIPCGDNTEPAANSLFEHRVKKKKLSQALIKQEKGSLSVTKSQYRSFWDIYIYIFFLLSV